MGISNCKLPMTEVEDSMIHDIRTPPYHGSYNRYCSAWADYVSGFHFLYCIFETLWLVLLCVAAAFRLEKDEF